MTPYEYLKSDLLEIGSNLENGQFVAETKWLHIERAIEEEGGKGILTTDQRIQLRQLLDELRLEHDLRMNPGTLGS
ncbi:MAG: hypothetical protein ACYC9S_07125 [Leptospirales bacterium]